MGDAATDSTPITPDQLQNIKDWAYQMGQADAAGAQTPLTISPTISPMLLAIGTFAVGFFLLRPGGRR